MLAKKRDKKIKSRSQLIIVGFLLILFGIICISGKYLYSYILDKQEKLKIIEFYNIQEEFIEQQEESESIRETHKTQSKVDYIAVIKIPKIGLEKGLYSKENKNNDISKNIQILKEADYPNVENGNFILAGHSGSGRIAFFKNLDKLSIEDVVFIYYQNLIYEYKLVNSYEIEKSEKATISRNNKKSTLTLITCKYGTNKQIIYIFELTKEGE